MPRKDTGEARGNYEKENRAEPGKSRSGDIKDITQYLVQARRRKTSGQIEDVPGLLRVAGRILASAIEQLEQPDREKAEYYFKTNF